jgi:hypothetical protein
MTSNERVPVPIPPRDALATLNVTLLLKVVAPKLAP